MTKIFTFDSYDPLVQKHLDKLDDYSEKTNTYESFLEKSLIQYEIYTDQLKKEDKDNLENIIDKISYTPVTVNLDKDVLKEFPHDSLIRGAYIEGVKEIIQSLTTEILSSKVKSVESIEYKDSISFNPISIFNDSVYENNKYIGEYMTVCNPNKFAGYQILSEDSLTRFVLEQWYNEEYYVPEDISVRYISILNKEIAIFPVGRNTYEQTELLNIKARLDNYINSLRKEGCFTYNVGIHDIENLELIKNLCRLWNIEIVDDTDLSIIVLKTNVDFGITPLEWIKQNLEIVKKGHFPLYKIYGNWQHFYYDDYQRIYGKQWLPIILKYASFLGYAQLAYEDNFIEPFTVLTNVEDDLSITVSLPTYSHVEKFKLELHKILSGDGYNFKSSEMWNLETCENLSDGIIKRWYVQSIDPSAFPMIFTDKSDNQLILIFKSTKAIKYPNVFQFTKENLEKAKNSLYDELKKYYSKCHDNLEPVLRERIDELSLEDLLRIVPIQENKKAPTYCFTQKTLTSLTQPIHPITRQPLSEKVLLKAHYMDEGLKGLFDVGPLIGLYEDVPSKQLVKTTVGVPFIKRILTDELMKNLVGNLFSVDVIFQDETISPLFEISLSTTNLQQIDELKKYVNKLWKKGFFLNYWNSAIQKYLINESNVKSWSIIVTDPILLKAGDSRVDGEMALDYLQRKYQTIV